MAEWKHFFAKVTKSFKNQCETEGARSHQSLWKPFRFWFVSLNFWEGGFGATVSHLMVPEFLVVFCALLVFNSIPSI